MPYAYKYPLLNERPRELLSDERGSYWRIELAERNYVTFLDEADFEEFGHRRWRIYQYRKHIAYLHWSVKRDTFALHRMIMGFPDCWIDHEDGNGLNNRRYNLRRATRYQNRWNVHFPSRGNSPSGYRGVRPEPSGRFAVIFTQRGINNFLGCFDDPVEAAKIWDAAAREARGEFTYQNFPVATNAK